MPPSKDWMSPLRRAETYLAVRLQDLERRLPVDGVRAAAGETPEELALWRDYIAAVAVFAQIRAQLYYAGPASAAPLPSRGAARGGLRS